MTTKNTNSNIKKNEMGHTKKKYLLYNITFNMDLEILQFLSVKICPFYPLIPITSLYTQVSPFIIEKSIRYHWKSR